jgi:hypothetical protein
MIENSDIKLAARRVGGGAWIWFALYLLGVVPWSITGPLGAGMLTIGLSFIVSDIRKDWRQ